MEAEYGWRELCEHGREVQDLTEAGFPTLSLLETRWRDEERAVYAYLANLRENDMTEIIRYTIPNGIKRERVLWHCLYHLVNNGTQHHSEAAAILTG
jgi:uncharacterized damage-inducible protein DinB